MIERTVLIRLKPEIRPEVQTVAAHTQEVLGEAVDDCADGKRMEADFGTCNPVLKTTWET